MENGRSRFKPRVLLSSSGGFQSLWLEAGAFRTGPLTLDSETELWSWALVPGEDSALSLFPAMWVGEGPLPTDFNVTLLKSAFHWYVGLLLWVLFHSFIFLSLC